MLTHAQTLINTINQSDGRSRRHSEGSLNLRLLSLSLSLYLSPHALLSSYVLSFTPGLPVRTFFWSSTLYTRIRYCLTSEHIHLQFVLLLFHSHPNVDM